MHLFSSLRSALGVLLLSLVSVFCTNFPPVVNPVPIPLPPAKIALDFGPDTILKAIQNYDFKPAERLPDSFPLPESTTEKPAGDQAPNDVISSNIEAAKDDWSPQSGTIGPVATPRPDDADGAPFQTGKDNVPYPLPPVQDDGRKPQPGSIWVFSRGISGQYTEQGWIPVDYSVPRPPPTSDNFQPGGSTNQNIPGNFPLFPPPPPPPPRPDLLYVPKDQSQGNPLWVPPLVPTSNIPRSASGDVPPVVRNPTSTIFVIQNGTFPYAIQPPPTGISIPRPSIPNLFPPVQYIPKPITFPVPKTFILPNPPDNVPLMTTTPAEETSPTPEVTTPTPTTTPQPVNLPPSTTTAPPSSPLPTYFIVQPKIQPFRTILIPPAKFGSSQITPTAYSPKINVDNSFISQYPMAVLPPSDQKQVPLSSTGSWIPQYKNLVQQFPQQSMWYQVPLNFNNQPSQVTPLTDSTPKPPTMEVTNSQTIPPPSSDLWIIRGANGKKVSDVPPSSYLPITPLPNPTATVPVPANTFPTFVYPAAIPSFPRIPVSFPVYPTQVNATGFYRLAPKFTQPYPTQQGLYFAPSNGVPYPFISRYSPDSSSSQLSSFPLPYQYPVVTYPLLPQSSQSVPFRNDQNCTSQNQNYPSPLPSAFYVQSPVYVPVPPSPSAYTFVPVRSPTPANPAIAYRPLPPADSMPTTEAPRAETEAKSEPQPVSEPTPPAPETPVTKNTVVAPVFPFFSPPVAFPKPAIKTPPYYFSYDRGDNQGSLQYRREDSDPDGTIKGSYGFRDASGIYRKIDYVSDRDWYRPLPRTDGTGAGSGQNFDSVLRSNDNSFTGSIVEKKTESEA